MAVYTVLILGNATHFAKEQKVVNELVNMGYKVDTQVEAQSLEQATAFYEQRKKVIEERKNPTKYLAVTSNVLLIVSFIGCAILVVLGIDAADSYRTSKMAPYFFASAFAGGLISLVIHAACRVLIYIARK